MNAPHDDARRPASDDLLRELRARFGDAVVTAEAARDHHGKDESWHAHALPDAVV